MIAECQLAEASGRGGSAASTRAELAAIGRALHRGGRGGALVGLGPPPPRDFAALHEAPAWLQRSPEELRHLARRASLRSAAATLAACIDGALLGRVAEACSEADLDAAIADAGLGDDRSIPAADRVEADGLALLAAALPEALRGYLPDGGALPFADAARARDWVARAA